MENNPEYFFEIVFLRAMAILAVISVHVASYFTQMSTVNFLTFFYMSIDTLSQVSIPLFVCISGFVLYNKYQGSYSVKIFYKKRFLSVVPQYTLFSLFAILLTYIYMGNMWNFTLNDLIYQYFSGGAFYHLWFFVLVIQIYILYPVIEKIFTKSVEKNRSREFLLFLFAVQITVNMLYEIFSLQNIFLMKTGVQLLAYLFYFVLGMYVRSGYLQYKNRVMTVRYSYPFFLALLLGTFLGIWNDCIKFLGYDMIPQLMHVYKWIFAIVTPLYYTVIFMACLFIALYFAELIPNNKITNNLHIIGKYSFGIYLVHAFVLYGIASIVLPKVGFDMNNWLFYPVVFTLVLGISLAILYFISKFPYHQYIIGSLR